MTVITAPDVAMSACAGLSFWLAARCLLPALAAVYERRAGLRAPIWHDLPLADTAAAGVAALPMLVLPAAQGLAAGTVCVALYAATRFDRAMQIIPDALQLTGLAGAVIWRAQLHGMHGPEGLQATALTALAWGIGLAACSFVYERWRGVSALGMGDVKLVGWLTILPGVDPAWLLAGALGAAWLWVLPGLWRRGLRLRDTFAFGPYLVVAAAVFIVGFLAERMLGGMTWGV